MNQRFRPILLMAVCGFFLAAGCGQKEVTPSEVKEPASVKTPQTPQTQTEPTPTETTTSPTPTPEPSEGEPGEGAPQPVMTPDECKARGGTFKPSTGTEVTCDPGQESLGPVRFGIEGGICCK